MRRSIYAAAVAAAIAGGASLPGSSAQAMPMPSGIAAAPAAAEKVYLSCTRFWNGWRWVRRCAEVGPAPGYYGPGYGYYGPRPYYGYGYGYGWRRHYW